MLWFKEQLDVEITSHPRIEASLWLGNESTGRVENGARREASSCCWCQGHQEGSKSEQEGILWLLPFEGPKSSFGWLHRDSWEM